ncbi:hypothetical protein AWZ03_001539 [Drosophila navojoa]|uniref:Uncharacterized protein n=1 Tax=Drosophila navojoa TaxID=7232 RepID=A0A484BSU4_DRONA|nr:salivary glue protein Sgs-5 [Drosophila navojoa]TDG51869.1 hypothetical protein AWZ03_001539 [Drosophila navojoa]
MFRVLFVLTAVVYAVESTFFIKPAPPIFIPPSKCNIYQKNLCWVLDECVCRPIQNPCLRDAENEFRIKTCRRPLVPVSEEICKYFIPKVCLLKKPVIASVLVRPKCGCKSLPDELKQRKFKSLCALQKFSAQNRTAYLNYKGCLF